MVINFGELFSDYFDRGGLLLNPPYRSEKTLEMYASLRSSPWFSTLLVVYDLMTRGMSLYRGLALPSLPISRYFLCRVIGEGFFFPSDVTIPLVSQHRRMKSFRWRPYDNVFVVASYGQRVMVPDVTTLLFIVPS